MFGEPLAPATGANSSSETFSHLFQNCSLPMIFHRSGDATMTRKLCILTGTILALIPFLMTRFGRISDPSHQQLTGAYGGDQYMYTPEIDCDEKVGTKSGKKFWVGCSKPGDKCRLCASARPDGSLQFSQFKKLKQIGSRGPAPGRMEDGNLARQNCGNQFFGTCVLNTKPGTKFLCVGNMGPEPCESRIGVDDQPLISVGTTGTTVLQTGVQ